MDLKFIGARLAADDTLTPEECLFLHASAQQGSAESRAEAFGLMRANPQRVGLTHADSCWLADAVDDEQNSAIAADALKLLCDWLGLARENRDRILRSLRRPVATNADAWLVITACAVADELLRGTADREVVARLLAILTDERIGHELRSCARDAVLRASGMTSRDIVLAEQRQDRNLWEESVTKLKSLLDATPDGARAH